MNELVKTMFMGTFANNILRFLFTYVLKMERWWN